MESHIPELSEEGGRSGGAMASASQTDQERQEEEHVIHP